MQQRLIYVDKTAVQKLQEHLYMLNKEATIATAEMSAMEIRACLMLLYKAMGILESMKQLELLSKEEIYLIKEEQNKMCKKIRNILYEKENASQVQQHQ